VIFVTHDVARGGLSRRPHRRDVGQAGDASRPSSKTAFDKADSNLVKSKPFIDKVDEIWNLVRDEAIKAQETRARP